MGRSIEFSPEFVTKWGDALAKQRLNKEFQQRLNKEFQYPRTPEERAAIEAMIKREYERCKDSYDYWYRNYYTRVNE